MARHSHSLYTMLQSFTHLAQVFISKHLSSCLLTRQTDLNRVKKWNQEKDLSSIRGTEAYVSAEDLNSDPRGRNHLAAPQRETNARPNLPSTNLGDRMGLFSSLTKNIFITDALNNTRTHTYTEEKSHPASVRVQEEVTKGELWLAELRLNIVTSSVRYT